MRRDLHNNLDYKNLFPPKAAVTDNTPQVSSIIDMAGSDFAEFALITGTLSDADATFATTFAVGDDPALADGAAPPTADLVGSLANSSFTFADDNKVKKLGYIGKKRYGQITVTPANNTGNLFLAGVAILSKTTMPSSDPPA